MPTLSINDSIQSVYLSLDKMIEIAKGLSDDILRFNPTEEEWSVMQILTHIVEAVPYWLDEIEQLLKTPGKEWGRGLQHEGRLAAVSKSKVDSTSLSDVLKQLEELKPQVEEVLNKLDEEKLAMEAPSRNPRFGTKPISFIVDHLLVEHAHKHLGQIERNLSKVSR
ncbi:DinB family protein [Metabacillus litoralis]|uniref:DinB family protein n=1 Tax=Metabacillus litoralis TaxID=152268 RepID=UPI0020411D16|nr:DinB family protein [Metabacillus litoralis]MCM3653413.1 DinB family protein [Metabacillus litoralis]